MRGAGETGAGSTHIERAKRGGGRNGATDADVPRWSRVVNNDSFVRADVGTNLGAQQPPAGA